MMFPTTAEPLTARARVNLAAAALVALGVPFAAFTNLVLYHFYSGGSFVLDTGLLAALAWHSDLALTQPSSVGGGSYFAIHVSPVFLVTSALSRLLPLSMPQFFAGFVGLSHALLALPVFWLLTEGFGLKRGASPWWAALAALGFAFSGLAIAVARYPHFETLVPALILLFAAAHALGHRRLAVLFFVAALTVREDAGFHAFGILALTILLNVASGQTLRRQRALCAYAAAALLCAVAVMAIQRAIFPDGSAFARIYLGTPPLAHLGGALILERLQGLVVGRPYVVYPAIAAALWAVRVRNYAIVVGFAASVPWLVLHLAAYGGLAGALASYYAFPFLAALGWPLVAVLQDADGPRRAAPALTGFAALIALTFVPASAVHDPGRLPLPAAFWTPPSLAQQAASDRAVAALSEARPMLGRLWVGNGVAALAPDGFAPAEVPFLLGDGAEPPRDAPDVVAFLADGYDAARLRVLADRHGLGRRYDIPDTPIRVYARRDLAAVAPLMAFLRPER